MNALSDIYQTSFPLMISTNLTITQSTGAEEYTYCFSAEG